MRYRMKTAAFVMMLVFVFMTGCGNGGKGTVAGTNYYYPEKESEQLPETDVQNTAAQLGEEHYMILTNDMTKEYLVLRQMESGMPYLYYYSLTTVFIDKYGNNTAVSNFEPGRIITIGGMDSAGKLKSARISDDVWEYEDIVRHEIDENRGVFKIADTRYSYSENLYVVSNGEEIKLSAIRKEDELRVVGMNKEILSVAVTTGQGTIKLVNTELFENSFIQIGSKIFAEITGEMELEIPEGNYMVTVANKGYGGSKEYEVRRNAVTEIDLDELKGDGPKMGDITFKIETADENEDAEIIFRIDGEETAYDEPVELAYGVHRIEAESFGYETFSKKLFVNSESATISIEMDTESSASLEEEEEQTPPAGTNSTAGESENNASSTDELVEALKEVLGDGSSTDYLSTITELLGNIIY